VAQVAVYRWKIREAQEQIAALGGGAAPHKLTYEEEAQRRRFAADAERHEANVEREEVRSTPPARTRPRAPLRGAAGGPDARGAAGDAGERGG